MIETTYMVQSANFTIPKELGSVITVKYCEKYWMNESEYSTQWFYRVVFYS